MQINTIGLDLAKNIFHVHCISADGTVISNRSLRRSQVHTFFKKIPACLVGMEACATSHHCARELSSLGHEVRLIPPSYVKPDVKRGKSDAVDAEAICEAVTRPNMRFVQPKSKQQQALLCLHRARELIVRQRTQIINSIRGLLAEFGVTIGQGVPRIMAFARSMTNGNQPDVPDLVREIVGNLSHQLLSLERRARWYQLRIVQHSRSDDRAKRLQKIPGIGPVTASAIVATVGNAVQFRNGRELAAWIGLTPLNRSSGGKERLGRISKMGDQYLRRLLIVGATSRLKSVRAGNDWQDAWVKAMLERKPFRLVSVAIANKTARIVWAILTKNEEYRRQPV
ncbi:MAG: IS110 family transposase [Pseudomonadota bacterium]